MRKRIKNGVLAIGRDQQRSDRRREANLLARIPEKSERTRRKNRAVTPRQGTLLKHFKDLMKKNAGKVRFVGHSE